MTGATDLPQHEQLPRANQVYLDHVGWMVPDMAMAEKAFDNLGLPLTPMSVHGVTDPATGARKPTGTANRLAMLRHGYLEILTPHGDIDNPTVQHLKSSIARHIGVHLLAFSCPMRAGRSGSRPGFKRSRPCICAGRSRPEQQAGRGRVHGDPPASTCFGSAARS
jgi:hypothetical protein